MADVDRTVGIGKCGGDQVAFVSFHSALDGRLVCGHKDSGLNDFGYIKNMMKHPPYLQAGDTIGLVAPARPIAEGEASCFEERMAAAGFKLRTGEIFRRYRQFSGSDAERLSDLQAMLDDPEIRAVCCVRGGYGAVRIKQGIFLEGFRRSPKWLVGFSDITVLHQLIIRECDTAVLHAAMPYTLQLKPAQRKAADERDLKSLIQALTGASLSYEIKPHVLNRTGLSEGTLVGGNLSVLYSLMGTKYQPDTRGKILFVEEVDEYLYHLDRMMWNFRLAGVFEGVRGLIIGHLTKMRDNEIPFGQTAAEIIREAVEPYNFPVCFGFPAGHEEPNLALRLGHTARLEVASGSVRFTQKP
jgi:muramoyltetrapeptide carboxypeptidase